ncbi:hypothetical protein [Fictibacillus gelatini]|uniref:hypothetical protein n=1 Tax=Fictibacillus gelatini TaxID=225985 RepID=UPI00041FCE21|nr:hypothetical protein [Fictibacillus gelatini]
MMKKIMEEAHKLAKQMEGDYAARLKLALKTVWAAVKNEVAITAVSQVKKNEWKKYGKHRVYADARIQFIIYKKEIDLFSFADTKVSGFADMTTGKFKVQTAGSRLACEAQQKAAKIIFAA